MIITCFQLWGIYVHLFKRFISLFALLAALFSGYASAQFGAGYGPPLVAISPEREFDTSDAHYQYLLQQADGGTQHTLESMPMWDGLWNRRYCFDDYVHRSFSAGDCSGGEE